MSKRQYTNYEVVHTSQNGRPTHRRNVVILASSVSADVLAGYVAWQLVRPGESLLWPTDLVALIAVVPITAWYFSVKSAGGWKRHRSLSLSVTASCLIPVLWSYFGVLPASVSWSSVAESWIHTSMHDGAQGCQVVSTGSVGFLRAPYKVCIDQNGTNSIVRFSTMDLTRGYAYVQGKNNVNWFPDQCARQILRPHWWAFYSNSTQTAGCPFGYPGHGGG